jgi:ribonucleoside-diphosphate reductase alpha chain
VFHKDIETFLDSRRENADDAIRINKLSLGIVVPDIFFELVKNNEDMYIFSPYDVAKKYGVSFAEVNITEVYRDLVNDSSVKKSKIRARAMLTRIAETQVESGYPYIMFEDTVNRANPIAGKIKMSNLCSEILQVQTPSVINDDQTYETLGKDISCNLGSINIFSIMHGGDFGKTIETGIRVLSRVATISDVATAPSIGHGNSLSRAVGLGAMNLHGYLASEGLEYGSDEALEFVDVYFSTVLYHAIRTSMELAKETGQKFDGFENSKYASGDFFKPYFLVGAHEPKSEKVSQMFEGHTLPDGDSWLRLAVDVSKYGMHNQNLQAVAPTGSISYVNNSTASLLPVTAKVETRKEGTMGQVYWPAPHMTNENVELYKDGYEIGWKAIVDTYAAAQRHVDQGMSLTLFFNQNATTREINKAQMYAWSKGIKTLYYARIKMNVMNGLEDMECVSCSI